MVAGALALAIFALVNRHLEGARLQGATLEPAVGRLLIASASLRDPNFSTTVVLLVAHGAEEGAVGLVLNRRSEFEVAEALAGSEFPAGRDDALYLGGPVALETVQVLLAADQPPAGAERILPDVYLVRERDGLEGLLATAPPPEEVRFYVGYAGWAPGQLEHEIERGDWGLLPGHERWIFNSKPREAWERLTRILFGPTA